MLEVTEGRERASAERLFESVALEQRENVEAVVMDMSAAFQAASEAKMPQAEIVHDRFHVAKHLNERSIRCAAPSIASFRGKEKRP